MNKKIKNLILLTNLLIFAAHLNVNAENMTFSSRGSSIVLTKGVNSAIRIKKAGKIFGWSLDSIVTDTGSYHPEKIVSGAIYGYGAAATATPPSNVLDNSTSIAWLDKRVRNDSNALAYYLSNSPGHIDLNIDTSTHTLAYDLCLYSPNSSAEGHKLNVSETCTIDGGGHTIYLGPNSSDVIEIAVGKSLRLTNVVINGFDDAAFTAGRSVIFGDGTVLNLTSNLVLSRNMTVDGDVLINGLECELDLGEKTILINDDYTLKMQNMRVTGLKNRNIVCATDSSKLILDNASLCLVDNYEFLHGKLEIERDVKLMGEKVFSYGSRAVSTIKSLGMLMLDSGLTFSYAPHSTSKDLISFEDSTATLFMNGCAFKTSGVGMRMTKGTLAVDNKNEWYNSGASKDYGIFLGQSPYVSKNLYVDILPGGSINMHDGFLVYDNVDY